MAERTVASGRAPGGSAARSSARRAWLAGWILLAVGACFAGWAGWWYTSSASPAVSAERDTVVRAASTAIADLNTVDDKHIAAWQTRWLAVTTGAEHSEVGATNAAAAAQIRRVKTSSAGSVTSIAVTSLRGGTAQVIATVRVVQTADSGASNTVKNRYLATLTLTGSGWKISKLSHV